MGQAAGRTAAPSKAPSVVVPAARTTEPAPIQREEVAFSGPGRPLPATTRERMERSFGQSFASVRVHDDAGAAALAQRHRAEAFTSGRDIAFAAGKYRPGTEAGDRLLAHELAHVVQQGDSPSAPVQAKSEVSTPNEPAEIQADAAASRVMSGQPAGVTPGSHAWTTRNRLMRKALSGGPSPAIPVPVPLGAPESKGPTEAPEADVSMDPVTGAPSFRRRKRPEGDAGVPGEPSREQAPEADVEEEQEATRERRDEDERERGAEGGRTPEGAKRDDQKASKKKEGAEAETAAGQPRQKGLAARLVAKALRTQQGTTEAAAKLGTQTRDKRAEESAATPAASRLSSGKATEPGAKKEAPTAPGAKEAIALAGQQLAEPTPEGKASKAPADEKAPETPKETKAGAEPASGLPLKKAKAEKAEAPEAKSEPGAKDETGEASKTEEAAEGPMDEKAAGAAAGGQPPGLLAERPAEQGPEGASPAAAAREPAAAQGGGGAPPSVGSGGAEGGAEAAADEKAVEEKMDARQPEDEAAAEAEQDEIEEAADEGAPVEEQAPEEAEAAPEPAPAPEPSADGPAAEQDTASADSEGTETSSEPTFDERAAEASGPEPQDKAQDAREIERAEAAAQENDAEAIPPPEPAPESPEAASGEDAQLDPAEKDAGLAVVAESVGGGPAPAGGGGGGGSIPEKPAPEPPDVSGQEPKAAMGSLKGQSPIAVKRALGGVSKSVNTKMGDRRAELAANAPTVQAPTGMEGKHGKTVIADQQEGTKKEAEKVPEGEAVETPEPEPLPELPPSPVNDVVAPDVSGGNEGEMSQEDAENMGTAIREMPTTDPELSTSAGPPPTVALEGNADPTQLDAQRAEMDASVAEASAQGRVDVATPMGEDEIAPQATDEQLTARIPGTGGGAGGGAAAGGGGASPDEETASIIAQEEKPGEIDAAIDKGKSDMATEETKERESSAKEREKTAQEQAKLEAQAKADQEAEKAAGKRRSAELRDEWSAEQKAAVDKGNAEADEKAKAAKEDIDEEKTRADEEADREIEEGEEKAEREKEAGEAEAEREKQKGEEESSGFFGWLASRAKAFFNRIKEGIKAAINRMREAVKAAIEAAKRAAVAIIERARQAVVGLIRAAGEALIAISDVVLAAFPEAKAKFQRAVRQAVQDAEDAVNRIADALKAGVQRLLDALGEFLDRALALLETALLAIVDAVAAVVEGVIKAAEAIAKAIGTFIVLVKDIAAGPAQWISNLGAAVVDGIRNHLVGAMKSAISTWFNQKVEEVLGIGTELMRVLFRGGVSLGEIAKMAWEALKSAIPGILIQILIEKLVAMIVPAAGAVMAVIEGLQAAWGTVSRILAAIDRFITFLKAVRGGGAGPKFANAVAAAAIAVIDFVANWLLRRLRRPAGKVAGKLRAMAKKILDKIKKGLKRVSRALRRTVRRIRTRLRGRPRTRRSTGRDRRRGANERREAARKQRALDRAMAAAQRLLSSRNATPENVRPRLVPIRARNRLTRLDLVIDQNTESETTVHVEGAINPRKRGRQKKLRKDGITKIRLKRATFTVKTKWELRRLFPGEHRKDIKDRPRLKKHLDRRHIISSQEMLEHYESVLNGKKWSEAARILNRKGSPVKDPPSNRKIQAAAQKRLNGFFNDVRNLFVGSASENRSIGDERDIPADWTTEDEKRHLRYIRQRWALGSFS